MFDPNHLVFIHGLEGSSRGVKASLLREMYPLVLTPDFRGGLDERMQALYELLGNETGWTIVGSSFGGLMAALFTVAHPSQVRKLILMAPALVWPDFANSPPQPISVPTIVYHGIQDEIIPLESVRHLAERIFLQLDFRVVDDDHGLYQSVHSLDWAEVLS